MNKAIFWKIASLSYVGATLGALCPVFPAHAVVLEQKWQQGQNLAYRTEVNGTANVQAPANAPFIFAGVPLEVEIRGKGLTELQTLKVDELGVGTVAVRIPKFDLNAQALGQKGQFSLQDATSKVTLNGKIIKLGDGTNPLAKPTVAMRISKQGRLLGVEELNPKPAAPATDDKPVDAAQAVNQTALMVAAITRALPTLWPGRDVQNGETWKADIIWPTPSPTDAQKTVPTQLGQWDLTLKGEEIVAGRALQRVGVKGVLNIDSTQMMTPAQRATTKASGKTKQEVQGDVWLDAVAGQIVRADLILGARVEGGQSATDTAWADFTGSVLLNLNSAA